MLPRRKVRAEINRTLACFCSEQVSPDPGKEVWEEWRREAEIRRQGCQTSTECIPKPLRPASQTSRSGLGPREIAGRAWSPRLALAWGQPRAPGACRVHSGQRETRGQTRRQTDAAVPGGLRLRPGPRIKGGAGELLLPSRPALPAGSALRLRRVSSRGPEPRGALGSQPRALVRVSAPSLRFKPGTFTCPGTPKNCMQNRLFECSPSHFFHGAEEVHPFICFSVGFTDPQRLRTTLPHQELQVLFWMQGGTL